MTSTMSAEEWSGEWSDEERSRSKRRKTAFRPCELGESCLTSFKNEVTNALRRLSKSCDPLDATVLINDIRTECNRLTAALEESPDEKNLREEAEEQVRRDTRLDGRAADPDSTDPIVELRAQVCFAWQAGAFKIKRRIKPVSWFEGRVPTQWLSDSTWRRAHAAELKNLTELETKCSSTAEALKSVPALVHESLDADEAQVLESVRRKIETANVRASSAVKTLTETTWAKRSLKDIAKAHHLTEHDKVKVVHGVSGCDFEKWIMGKLKAAGVSVPEPWPPMSQTVKEFDFVLRWASEP